MQWKVGIAAILAVVISWGTREVIVHHAAKAAAVGQAIVAKDTTQAVQHEVDAKVDAVVSAQHDAQAAPVAGRAGRLRSEAQALALADSRPVAPKDPPVDLAPLVAKLTELNVALDAQHTLDLLRIADRDKSILDLTAASSSWKAACQASQAENAQLHIQLSAKSLPWTAGAIYGSNGTVGGFLERTLGPIEVGLDIVRRPVAGGQTSYEALGRAGVRF